MCQFQGTHAVLICPVVADQVQNRLREVFGELIQCSRQAEQGTLIQVSSNIDSLRFQAVTQEAITEEQNALPKDIFA